MRSLTCTCRFGVAQPLHYGVWGRERRKERNGYGYLGRWLILNGRRDAFSTSAMLNTYLHR